MAAVNKGGFDIEISGLRAFCPISQIDLQYCEKPEEHLGAKYQFRIIEMKERGKNIILSRRALLKEEQEKKLKETLATLKPDLELEGKVTRVTDFGAFVEILPGTEGLIHISQLDNSRVKNVRDILNEGDEVRVKVLDIDRNGKIRLSRKEALGDVPKDRIK